MTSKFLTPLTELSGVGEIREAALRARGLVSVLDLLLFVPRTYRTIAPPAARADVVAGSHHTIVGIVTSARRARQRHGGSFLDLVIDAEGPLRVCFYNRGYLKDKLTRKDRVLVTGRMADDGSKLVGQDLFVIATDVDLAAVLRTVIPAHPTVPNVAEGTLRRLVRQALDLVVTEADPLTETLRAELCVAPLHEALRRVHEPCRGEDLGGAGERLLFDRLLGQALAARVASVEAAGAAPALPAPRVVRERILARIPFPLTAGQAAALDEVLADVARPVAMRRLLLGDVGSGKTAVAAGALLAAVAAKHQGLLVAPTDLLAAQHYATLSGWLAGSNVRLALLTGRVSRKDAAATRQRIAGLGVDIVIGTHAALAASVRFPRLGLVVFDEQHRFGVMQRLSGRNKANRPHVLALSATPIPRSLCLALFGELAITRLAGRPRGTRTPPTRVTTAADAWLAVRAAVALGERAFVVFPSIAGESTSGVEREGRALTASAGALAGLPVGFLHSAVDGPEQIATLDAFRRGTIRVLVCTVIVEVGIDVPEATVIVVQGAERFGLATLHQLRGRVGRGDRPGAAFLVPSPDVGEADEKLERLRVLEREADGFKIAEADLNLRGPGDWCGVRQHGFGGALPLSIRGDAGLVLAVERACSALIANGYDRHAPTYYAELGRSLAPAFDPKDPV